MSEMVDDSLDALDEDNEELEEEADQEVEGVLFEITDGKLGQAGKVGGKLPVRPFRTHFAGILAQKTSRFPRPLRHQRPKRKTSRTSNVCKLNSTASYEVETYAHPLRICRFVFLSCHLYSFANARYPTSEPQKLFMRKPRCATAGRCLKRAGVSSSESTPATSSLPNLHLRRACSHVHQLRCSMTRPSAFDSHRQSTGARRYPRHAMTVVSDIEILARFARDLTHEGKMISGIPHDTAPSHLEAFVDLLLLPTVKVFRHELPEGLVEHR